MILLSISGSTLRYCVFYFYVCFNHACSQVCPIFSALSSRPQVYRHGLQAIPLSVDLWLHYLSFIKENADPADPETEGRIRA